MTAEQAARRFQRRGALAAAAIATALCCLLAGFGASALEARQEGGTSAQPACGVIMPLMPVSLA